MKRHAWFLAAVAAVVLVGGGVYGQATANKNDQRNLEGEWEIESVSFQGMVIPFPGNQGKMTITFKGDKAVSNDPNGMREESTFKLDPTKMPKHIDITSDKQGGMNMKGVYQLEGDTFKIAFGGNNPGAERPGNFEGKELIVMTLKRVKK